MPISIFEGCSDYCGWVAGIIAVFAFGSFGVPIKGTAKVDVHPLVMQSYKTIVCFMTCWFVLLLGEEVRFTPWGIVSGMFWVPGGVCGVYGIRNAGLAIAVGTWSSIIVISSFVWGIIIFQERVKSIPQTGCAFAMLILGLVGMSRYSKPPPKGSSLSSTVSENGCRIGFGGSSSLSNGVGGNMVDEEGDTDSSDGSDEGIRTTKRKVVIAEAPPSGNGVVLLSHSSTSSFLEMEPLKAAEDGSEHKHLRHHHRYRRKSPAGGKRSSSSSAGAKDAENKDRFVFCGGRLALSRRQLGLLASVVNGAWGGLNLIPLHFASEEGFGGASYLISYATGSLLVNTALWVGLLCLHYWNQRTWSIEDGLEALPKWHLKELWFPGLLAGSLYSLGNFGSILSVTYLGHGVGFSLCQVSILISGLWGIFYYKEIEGRKTILKWFGSAITTIVGILWLSYEHGGMKGHR